MIKRYLSTLTLLIFAVFVANGQKTKVLERSSKSVPQWLGTQPSGCIVADVEASDIAQARAKALEALATQTVMAVASNVIHTSSSSASVESTDGVLNETETFGYDTRVAAANIPFIKGITLSEATDTYWEKLREDKTDRIYYRFAVLYPLPQDELERMRSEFDRTDREHASRLECLKEGLHKVRKSTDIEEAVNALEALKAYFFDNVRHTQAESLQKDYKGLYKSLTLQATKPSDGSFKVTVLLDGHPFEVTGLITLKANCASRMDANPLPDGTGFEITYSDIDCLDDEDNWIDVSLRLRDARLSKRVFL